MELRSREKESIDEKLPKGIDSEAHNEDPGNLPDLDIASKARRCASEHPHSQKVWQST
jgi:hypothetical protein